MKKVILNLIALFFWNSSISQFLPLTYLEDQIFDRTLNTSLEVGSISGEFTVSSTGAANYTIPIKVPAGTNGIQPSLSINYNSQASNGLLGLGWSLSGLSSVMRTPSNLFLDNTKREILIDNNDRLSLDGKSLILISGNNLESNSVYGFEVEDYSRLKAKYKNVTATKDPDFFELKDDNGTITIYGEDNNSRVRTPAGNIVWRVNKIQDVNGNYMKFYYKNTNVNLEGESYIDFIDYTQNDGFAPLNSPYFRVKFNYNIIEGKEMYLKNHTITNNLILKSIDIIDLASNVIINRYEFNYFRYGASYFSVYLGEIIYSSGNKSLNSTVINWGAETNSFRLTTTSNIGYSDNERISIGDFNGDGFSDILRFNRLPNHKVYLGSKTGISLFSANQNFGGFENSIIFDINKDGKDDWVRYTFDAGSSIGNYNNQIYTLKSNGFVLQDNATIKYPPISSLFNLPVDPPMVQTFPGDFDGDGEPDLFHAVRDNIYGENCCYDRFMKDYSPDSSLYQLSRKKLTDINLDFLSNTRHFSVDFNGNGITEVFAVGNKAGVNIYGCIEYDSATHKFNLLFQNNLNPPIHTLHEKRIYNADFNGDGKTDILVFNQFGNYWKQYISKGSTFKSRFLDPNELPNPGEFGYVFAEEYENGEPVVGEVQSRCGGKNNIVFGDFNGDGLLDIAYLKIEENDGEDLYSYFINIYYFNGFNFVNSEMKISLGTWDDDCEFVPDLYTGDFNGDGNSDLFITMGGDQKTIDKIIYFNENSLARNVVKITNGYNNSINIYYNTLSNSNINAPDVYEKTAKIFDQPLIKVQAPLKVVSSTTNPNGIGGLSTTSYYYYDLISHPKGRGVLGFGEMRVQAPNGWITRTINDWNAVNFFFNSKSQTIVYKTNNLNSTTLTDIVKEETSGVSYFPINNTKRKKVESNRNIKIDYQSMVKELIDYSYFPNHGEIQKITTTYYDLINSSDYFFKETEFVQYNSVGTFLRPRANRRRETNNYAPNGVGASITRFKEFSYNSKGQLYSSVDEPDDPIFKVVTNLEYNITGTIDRKEIIGFNGDPLINTISYKYLYDSKHRFVEKEINEKFSTTLAPYSFYDIYTGKIVSRYDLIGNKVQQIDYDNFERPIRTIDQFLNIANTEYGWSDRPEYLYYIQTSGNDIPTKREYFDGLGRGVYSETEGYNGIIINKKEYNSKGLVSKVYTPRYQNEDEEFTIFTYDSDDRIESSTTSCGQVISNNYYPRKTEKIDAAGRISSEEYDVLGRVIKTKDIGGNEVTSTYFPDGNLSTVTSFGLTTSFVYNIQGKRIEINEPNSGKTASVYSELGLLLSNVDNKGNTIFYYYNSDHTLKEKSIFHYSLGFNSVVPTLHSSELVNYYYATLPNHEFGLLKSVTSSKNTSKNFSYNLNRQMQSINEFIHSKNFITSYDYYSNGKLKTTLYPNGFAVQNGYDSKGFFNQVIDNSTNQVLYSLLSQDALGRERSFSFGANIDFNQPVENPGIGSVCGVVASKSYNSCNTSVDIKTLKAKTIAGVSQPIPALIYNLGYNVDLNTQNITRRDDLIKSKSETFTYDSQDRLLEIRNHLNIISMSHSYYINGNIEQKSEIGQYAYNLNDHPHAVSKIIGFCDMAFQCAGQQDIQYNGYNKPSSIMQGKWQMNLNYNVDGNRNFQELYQYPSNINIDINRHHDNKYNPNPLSINNGQWGNLYQGSGTGLLKMNKYFSDFYEEIEDISSGVTKGYSYINGPYGVFGVNIQDITTNSSNTYMIQKDIQGSYMALIDYCGNIKEEYSYDAWGRRRNPYNWSYFNLDWKPSNIDPISGEWSEPMDGINENPPAPQSEDFYCFPNYNFMISRGYIGQEHYDMFGLINLNARLYDPLLGRMLSPDALVGDPSNSQSYNRYSYAKNNPLKYSDPDGNNPILIAGLISAGISMATQFVSFATNSNPYRQWDWFNFTFNTLSAFVQGAMTSQIGQSIDLIKASWTVKELGRAFAHGGVGAFFSGSSGGNALTGFVTSFTGSFAGSSAHAATSKLSVPVKSIATIGTSGLVSGTIEQISGGNFWHGLGIGLTIATVNHMANVIIKPLLPRYYGKFFKTFEEFKEYLLVTTKEQGIETSGVEILDRNLKKYKYFSFPWEGNSVTKSYDHPVPGFNGFVDKIIQNFHTHIIDGDKYITSGVSTGDVEYSLINKIPVNAIYSNGNVWTYFESSKCAVYSLKDFPEGVGYGWLNKNY